MLRGTLMLLLLLASAEVAFRLAARFVPNRITAWRPGATQRILCAGDSHTYGGGVEQHESYPAQLQEFLDRVAPNVYSVKNVGVPGMSTTQVLNRLPGHVNRFHPDTLVIWCGVNDAWNKSEMEVPAASRWSWLEGLASRLRLYRLVAVTLHDLGLERAGVDAEASLAERPVVKIDRVSEDKSVTTVTWGEKVERFENEGHSEYKPSPETQARAERDYEAMIRYARGAGLRVMLVTYPLQLGGFVPANQAMRAVAVREKVPLIESTLSLERVPKEQRKWAWALHPTGPIYREIARDVAAAVAGKPIAPDSGLASAERAADDASR